MGCIGDRMVDLELEFIDLVFRVWQYIVTIFSNINPLILLNWETERIITGFFIHKF